MPREPISAARLFRKAGKLGIPLHGAFELTPVCNMSCEMCYVRKTMPEVQAAGGLLTADDWYEMGVQAQKAGLLYLLLTGGEPFTYPGFLDLYEKLRSLGLMIAINSNATLLDEETVKRLAANKPYRMQITLYGGNNETYHRLCHNPKGFDQVIHSLDLLKKYNVHFKLNATMTPANIADLEEIYRIAREYNAYVQATPYMFPPVRRDEELAGQGFRFTPEEAGKHLAHIDCLRYEEEMLQNRIQRLNASVMEREGLEEEECGRDPYEPMGCRAGRSSFWLNWQGKMTACGMQNAPCAFPFQEGFHSAWQEIRERTAEVRLPAKCSRCKNRAACMVCGAAVYCENGTMNNEAPEYVCKMTESYLQYLNQK